MNSIVVPARFNGPPASGHGGYSAGLAAQFVDGPAEVSLRAPPPLERPLAVEPLAGGGVRVVGDEGPVLEARPATVDVDPPDAVPVAEAEEATTHSPFLEPSHPFPTCFACGPRRAPGDGLRLFAGPVRDGEVFAVPWVPAAEFGPGGVVDPLFVWAALDCPSCAPGMGENPIVLASLAVDVRAPVAVGEPHVIASWGRGQEGRKRHTGVALWNAGGELRAVARALWIELRTSA